MRRLRRSFGVVTLSLLASATTASADCAWVAWLSSLDKTGLTTIMPIGASDSKADCQQRVEDVRQGFEVRMKEQGLVALSVVCLPDTVEPRGPKGK